MATKKTVTKKTAKKATKKTAKQVATMVAVAKTNYHYYRHFVKSILTEGKIKNFRFKKNEDSYDGILMVDSKELVNAKSVLDKYKKDNPDVVEMWSY